MQNMFHKKGKPPAHFANHVLGRPFNCAMGLAGLVLRRRVREIPEAARLLLRVLGASGSSTGCTAWTTISSS